MPYIDRNGVSIYYEQRGTGPSVLLSHGYGAGLRMWDRQVEVFSDRYRMITWDMRGHGQSDSPDDPDVYSHEATVADMAAILDTCGVDTVVLGGLSLGGYVSLAFHLAHRDRVRALMLFDTGPGYKKEAPRADWNRYAAEAARGLEAKGLAMLGKSPEVLIAEHHSAQGLAHAARGILAQKDASVIESLPQIEVPALVLVGGNDKLFFASTDYMAAKIPGAKKVIIDAAGHAPNIEKPEAFNNAMASFLEDLKDR